MTLSAFSDRSHPPTEEELREVLGKAHGAWLQLLASIAERVDPLSHAWGFTSASTGWGLRVRHRERVLLYMTPQPACFLVSLALGEKAVAAARSAKLPGPLLQAIETAPRYAEGRGVRIVVKNGRQVEPLAKLAGIKQQN